MKAIVHIGQPKAGSSTLQEFLRLNTRELARQGVRYDKLVEKDRHASQFHYALGALSSIGALIRNKHQRVRRRARTLEEQSERAAPFLEHLRSFPDRFDEPVAVFSSEHFIPMLDDRERVAALDALFSETFDSVTYVAYLRHPVDQLASAYSERIKRGRAVHVDDFIEQRQRSLDFYTPIRRWADVVGRDRLQVRLLDPSFLAQGDLLQDFCDLCGLDPAPMTAPGKVNVSLTAPAIECLRSLNATFPEIRPQGGFNPLRRNLLSSIIELSRDDEKFRFTTAQGARIETYAAPHLETLKQEFFPDRTPLFETRPVLAETRDIARIRERALAIMAQVVVQLRLGEIPELTKRQKTRAVVHS